MSQATPKNDALVEWLSAYFQKHGNPVITYSATVASSPPSDADLDSAFDSPANLPQPFLATVTDGSGRVRLVVAVGGGWYYSAAWTLAV